MFKKAAHQVKNEKKEEMRKERKTLHLAGKKSVPVIHTGLSQAGLLDRSSTSSSGFGGLFKPKGRKVIRYRLDCVLVYEEVNIEFAENYPMLFDPQIQ